MSLGKGGAEKSCNESM